MLGWCLLKWIVQDDISEIRNNINHQDSCLFQRGFFHSLKQKSNTCTNALNKNKQATSWNIQASTIASEKLDHQLLKKQIKSKEVRQ